MKALAQARGLAYSSHHSTMRFAAHESVMKRKEPSGRKTIREAGKRSSDMSKNLTVTFDAPPFTLSAKAVRLVDDTPGQVRRSGVGVTDGKRVIHMAPAANVPSLINNLFGWLKKAPDHLLVKSCVFHYEFEFINPFADGNGRMGRPWQPLILGKWNPAFRFLPVENMVHASQQACYDAINAGSAQADCAPFIDFMLGEIHRALGSRSSKRLSSANRSCAKSTTNFMPQPRVFPQNCC